jgi:hypothetical protein
VLSWSGVVLRCVTTFTALAALFLVDSSAASSRAGSPQEAAKAAAEVPLPHARPAGDAAAISRGLARAVRAGRLSRAEANEYRGVVRRTRVVLGSLRGSRRTILARVLDQVSWFAAAYNRPRALSLFSMLGVNARYLARRPVPRDGTDVRGPGGIIYRAGWGYGLQFHPLGNAIELNRKVTFGTRQGAIDHASALAARLVPKQRGADWEYYVPYAGGSPPWSSGMAQAVGAQGLARAGRRFTAPDFFPSARRAYNAIPGRLVRRVSTGPWIRLYGFSGLVVLNAQLQSVLSIANYARTVDDVAALGFADTLEDSARALYPRAFDTGYWSNYSPGNEAPLKYHLYHVQLARRLAEETNADFWAQAATRLARYTREPPQFRSGAPGPTLYPRPAEGFRDRARIAVWISKSSSAVVRVGGTRFSLSVRRKGWYRLVWSPGARRPGIYRPVVSAVDRAGNRGSARLAPIRIAVDREPPKLTARLEGRRLIWRAVDPGTPWLRMTVLFRRPGETRKQSLGRRPLSGSARLAYPPSRWLVILFAMDSSGNRARLEVNPSPAGS